MLDVVFGRLTAVADGLLRVAMRDEGLMRCMGVVFLRVISRGFAVMPRRFLVMVRCGLVVLGSAEKLAHEVPPILAIPGAHRASELIGPRSVPADAQDTLETRIACGPASASRMRGAECSPSRQPSSDRQS